MHFKLSLYSEKDHYKTTLMKQIQPSQREEGGDRLLIPPLDPRLRRAPPRSFAAHHFIPNLCDQNDRRVKSYRS